jgi:8-oxo-dGTP pyrophosphatase MutT (NUDIX family)
MNRKHPTASVFVFARIAGGWRVALVCHPRYRKWMVPGGHVEAGENPAEAACREVAEETGLAVILLAPPDVPPSAGHTGRLVSPWWIVEEPIPAGTEPHREPRRHVHVDAWYVALAKEPERADGRPDAEQLTWWDADELAALDMFEGTRMAARWLFANLDRLAQVPHPPVRAARNSHPGGRVSSTQHGGRRR